MRALTTILTASAIGIAWAEPEASVYFFDKVHIARAPSDSIPSTSPQAARLLLAQRLGLSQYHSLKDADEYTLQALNQFRDTQHPLFSSKNNDERIGKLLVVVEGVEAPGGALSN
jgi:hypothetical protein